MAGISKSLHIGSVVTNIVLLAGFVSTVFAVDTRYVKAAEFQQFHQDYMESDIRDLRKELREAERAGDTEWYDDVMEELEELLDELCLQYPNSRYCGENR